MGNNEQEAEQHVVKICRLVPLFFYQVLLSQTDSQEVEIIAVSKFRIKGTSGRQVHTIITLRF